MAQQNSSNAKPNKLRQLFQSAVQVVVKRRRKALAKRNGNQFTRAATSRNDNIAKQRSSITSLKKVDNLVPATGPRMTSKGKSSGTMESALLTPFDSAGHLSRWATPFTMYQTDARSGYQAFSPTIFNYPTGNTGSTYLMIRGDGFQTLTYNYDTTDGVCALTTTGATTLTLGTNSSLFYERPTGIGLKVKYYSTTNDYQARVICVPLPPSQNAALALSGYIPVDARLPITDVLRKLGARDAFISNGQSAEVVCVPVDSRGLDLLPGNAARVASGWNNWWIAVQAPNSAATDAKITCEVVYHYEGIELIGTSTPTTYNNPIQKPDQARFDSTISKVIGAVERGFNCVVNSGPLREAVATLGHLAASWMGMAILPKQTCTNVLVNYANLQSSLTTCAQPPPNFNARVAKLSQPDEVKVPDIEDLPLNHLSDVTKTVNALTDPPEMVTPKNARRPSLALSLTSRKK